MSVAMRIESKLSTGLALVVLLVSALGIVSVYQLNALGSDINAVPDGIKRLGAASTLSNQVVQLRYLDEALAHSAAAFALTSDWEWENRYNLHQSELERLLDDLAARAEPTAYLETFHALRLARLELVEIEREAISLAAEGDKETAAALLDGEKARGLRAAFSRELNSYHEKEGVLLEGSLEKAVSSAQASAITERQTVEATYNWIVLLVAASLATVLIMAYLVTVSVSLPLKKIAGEIEQISLGNISVETSPELRQKDDEIGDLARAFDRTLSSLKIAMKLSSPLLKRESDELKEALREKEKTQLELESERAALAEAQRIAKIGSWEWDVPKNVVTWSDELYNIYGLADQKGRFDTSYEGFLNLVHPDDREKAKNAVENSFKTAEPFEFTYRTVTPSGEIRTHQARGRVFTDDKGNVVKMTGTGQDITGQVAREEALRKKTEELERVNRVLVGRELKMAELKKELEAAGKTRAVSMKSSKQPKGVV